MSTDPENLAPAHLKEVSRIKHIILEKYLPPWSAILGSGNAELCYFDCYAGPAVYTWREERVDGSPVIAVKAAQDYLKRNSSRRISIYLCESDEEHLASLKHELKRLEPHDSRLQVTILASDAKQAVPTAVAGLAYTPTFFLIDPYGHPLTIPIINNILSRDKTEALINFMYYRINMDSGNPKVLRNVDEMFGDQEWRSQPFMAMSGTARERAFLEYFCSKLAAPYCFPFRIKFDREDAQSSDRTKYYLIHVSKHPKAVLLMKEIMWPLGDEAGTFAFGQAQSGLFSEQPALSELKQHLLNNYSGKTATFDQIREETWKLPFIEKDYRTAIKDLKSSGHAKIQPVSSKTERGLSKSDRVTFS